MKWDRLVGSAFPAPPVRPAEVRTRFTEGRKPPIVPIVHAARAKLKSLPATCRSEVLLRLSVGLINRNHRLGLRGGKQPWVCRILRVASSWIWPRSHVSLRTSSLHSLERAGPLALPVLCWFGLPSGTAIHWSSPTLEPILGRPCSAEPAGTGRFSTACFYTPRTGGSRSGQPSLLRACWLRMSCTCRCAPSGFPGRCRCSSRHAAWLY